MIGVSHISVAAYRGGGGAPSVNPDFISTWDTTKAGSASDTVVLPLLSGGTYNGTIDWGDGNSDALSYANRTHVYASSGIYTITISGSDIQGFQFANVGDKAKIADISNWGNLTITTDRAFHGCSNLDVTATDAPIISSTSLANMFSLCSKLTGGVAGFDVSSVLDVSGMFRSCSLFNDDVTGWDVGNIQTFGTIFSNTGMFQACTVFNQDISGWNVSSATQMGHMFAQTKAFNQDLSSWDVSGVYNFYRTFYDADAFDQDISAWDITSVSDIRDFMATAIGLSTSNYDALLIGWEATLQATWAGGTGYPYTIITNFGGSKYTGGGAADAARTSLISNFGWTITDGGAV